MPNFVVAYALLAVAIARPRDGGAGAAVRAGARVYDLSGSAARWGAWPSCWCSRPSPARRRGPSPCSDNDTLFMPLVHPRGRPRWRVEALYGALLHGAGASPRARSTRSCTARCRARSTTAWRGWCCTRSCRARPVRRRAGSRPALAAAALGGGRVLAAVIAAAVDGRRRRVRRHRGGASSVAQGAHEVGLRRREEGTCARWATVGVSSSTLGGAGQRADGAAASAASRTSPQRSASKAAGEAS